MGEEEPGVMRSPATSERSLRANSRKHGLAAAQSADRVDVRRGFAAPEAR
jgi:hypothetical protein